MGGCERELCSVLTADRFCFSLYARENRVDLRITQVAHFECAYDFPGNDVWRASAGVDVRNLKGRGLKKFVALVLGARGEFS